MKANESKDKATEVVTSSAVTVLSSKDTQAFEKMFDEPLSDKAVETAERIKAMRDDETGVADAQ